MGSAVTKLKAKKEEKKRRTLGDCSAVSTPSSLTSTSNISKSSLVSCFKRRRSDSCYLDCQLSSALLLDGSMGDAKQSPTSTSNTEASMRNGMANGNHKTPEPGPSSGGPPGSRRRPSDSQPETDAPKRFRAQPSELLVDSQAPLVEDDDFDLLDSPLDQRGPGIDTNGSIVDEALLLNGLLGGGTPVSAAGPLPPAIPVTPQPAVQRQPLVERTRSKTDDENRAGPSNCQEPLGFRRAFRKAIIETIEYSIPAEGYIQDSFRYLGGGSFGNVVIGKMISRDSEERQVTIKKLYDPFRNASHARRVFREIRLLKLMNHENVIRAVDMYTPEPSPDKMNTVFVVTEYAGYTLRHVLNHQVHQNRRQLLHDHVKFIVYQILRGLKYIHSANIIHRDLKPENLALTTQSDLTILDFGLARSLEISQNAMTQYVMTRWYRSPEVHWDMESSYTSQADMWSVGCIMAELILNRPLFPGNDAREQFDKIVELCGSPDRILLDKIADQSHTRTILEHMEQHTRKDLREYFTQRLEPEDPMSVILGDQHRLLFDFLDHVLVLDPDRRLTVEEALRHPYLEEYSVPDDEPEAGEKFDLRDDEVHRTVGEWKKIIWDEIRCFHGDDHSPVFAPAFEPGPRP